MNPSLEDIQNSLNKACLLILDISKGMHQWGQDRSQIEEFLAKDREQDTFHHHQGLSTSITFHTSVVSRDIHLLLVQIKYFFYTYYEMSNILLDKQIFY